MNSNTKQLINDRYRFLETIGQGGFGTTYKAIDESLSSEPLCVIKQFTFVGKNKNTALELFYREAEHLKVLGDHPQIPTLIESFDVDGQPYLVQQYIDGQNLEEELKVEIFTQERIGELLDSLLPVLAYVHSHELIHRDIKPANIIRQAHDGKLFLVDFGAVKLATQTMLAKTGTSIGSAEFVSIEQGRGKATWASDIYSLGVTCINLLTGVSPFDLMTQDNDWCWRDYLGGNPVGKDLGEILDKMIAQSQSGRYKSVGEVIKAISEMDDQRIKQEKAERSFAIAKKKKSLKYRMILLNRRFNNFVRKEGVVGVAAVVVVPLMVFAGIWGIATHWPQIVSVLPRFKDFRLPVNFLNSLRALITVAQTTLFLVGAVFSVFKAMEGSRYGEYEEGLKAAATTMVLTLLGMATLDICRQLLLS